MKDIVNEVNAFYSRSNGVRFVLNTGKTYCKSAQQKYFKSLSSLKSKVKSYLQFLEDRQKLESANMELYNLDDLNYLPHEVAVNTVLLMCFNSLITSSFYDDTLAKTDLDKLTPAQEEFFNKFDASSLEFYYGDEERTLYYPGQKAYLLLCLREALCHGKVSYKIPTSKKNEPVNFNETVICFKTGERQNSTIYGTIQDFYNLFTSKAFLSVRDKAVITGKQKEMSVESEQLTEIDEENYKKLNEIVQELKFVDESFRNL